MFPSKGLCEHDETHKPMLNSEEICHHQTYLDTQTVYSRLGVLILVVRLVISAARTSATTPDGAPGFFLTTAKHTTFSTQCGFVSAATVLFKSNPRLMSHALPFARRSFTT